MEYIAIVLGVIAALKTLFQVWRWMRDKAHHERHKFTKEVAQEVAQEVVREVAQEIRGLERGNNPLARRRGHPPPAVRTRAR